MFSVHIHSSLCPSEEHKIIWRLHTEPYKYERNLSANNSRKEHRTDLRLTNCLLFNFLSYLKFVVFMVKRFQIYFLIA